MRNASLFLLLGAVCLAAVLLGRRQAPPPPPTPPAAAEAPAPSASASLRFESTPAGAEVVGPSGRLGVTPFSKEFAAGTRPKSVLFRLKGHFTQQRVVPPTGDVVQAKMLPR